MCHSRTNNRKINRFHERFLRITYNDKQSWFSELLEKDCSVSIRMRNVQYLTTEMFPVSRNIHCVKMSKYGVFSGPYFPAFSPNVGKYGPEKTLYLDTFHTVILSLIMDDILK